MEILKPANNFAGENIYFLNDFKITFSLASFLLI